jgi:ribosomal protein S12 methylthiotransferase accessory factor
MEEAILHGILELVERDALAIWWYNQPALPPISLSAAEQPGGPDLSTALRDLGWTITLHDVTTDVGIPAAVAIAENSAGEWVLGSAAHLNARSAFRNAVRELLLLLDSRRRPAPRPRPPSTAPAPLLPVHAVPDAGDIRELVDYCCAALARAGHEVIVFDLTRSDMNFSVVRVVAPGLRHPEPRFAPGRLYDVPVRLGWRNRPAREEQMPPSAP